MKFTKQIADYLSGQRWCNFKEEIRLKKIKEFEMDSVSFDNGNKLLVIANVTNLKGKKHYFFMPLASVSQKYTNALKIGNKYYTDALQSPDYWQKMMTFLAENNNTIQFDSGMQLHNRITHNQQFIQQNLAAKSRPLGVEQSNTTLAVGDNTIAFKQERILDFSNKINPEFTMNDKLMREGCTVMPQTYGGQIIIDNEGKIASAGIIQEFVENQGDFWNYAQNYLQTKLKQGYLIKRDILPEENQEFMDLMHKLSIRTAEMTECLSRPDDDPSFTPEPVTEKFIREYSKQMTVLLYQTHRNIVNNLDKLPEPTHNKAQTLLNGWEKLTTSFVADNLQKIENNPHKGYITRVHGDFHLGQVMVTKDNDLKFIDFAGEPALPLEERDRKHIYVRDIAGMYRSIKGYMGAVAVEDFVNSAPNETVAAEHRKYAEKAIRPIVNEAAQTFLGSYSAKEPWLALEIFRKNLYEVNYEVNNRPQMAYVAINGLADMLLPASKNQIKTKEKDRVK